MLLLDQARPAYVEWLASINRLIDLEEAKNKAESAQARSVAGMQYSQLAGLHHEMFGVLPVSLCESLFATCYPACPWPSDYFWEDSRWVAQEPSRLAPTRASGTTVRGMARESSTWSANSRPPVGGGREGGC